MAKVVEDEADKSGYRVIFCSTENREDKATALLTMLKHRQMDGFIITPTEGMLDDIRELAADGRPLVLVDRYFPDLDTSFVTVDNYGSSRKGVELMLDKGSKTVAIINLDSDQLPMQERQKGYTDALRAWGLAAGPELVLKVPFPLAQDRTVAAISGFLQAHPEIDGLFFTTNYLGVAGLEALRDMGRRVPEDIRLLCFDDNDLFRIGRPSVTAIAQPIEQIGEMAVRLLVDMLATKSSVPVHHILPTQLIVRESI